MHAASKDHRPTGAPSSFGVRRSLLTVCSSLMIAADIWTNRFAVINCVTKLGEISLIESDQICLVLILCTQQQTRREATKHGNIQRSSAAAATQR